MSYGSWRSDPGDGFGIDLGSEVADGDDAIGGVDVNNTLLLTMDFRRNGLMAPSVSGPRELTETSGAKSSSSSSLC